MAISGDGAASYESGGAGGKFRKRPFRRPQTTPYDRPLSSIRNPNSKGWLSKLIDPASKLLMASAQFFFSSVFRKRLTSLPQQIPHPQPGANQEQGEFQKDLRNNDIEAHNTSSYEVGSPKQSSDGNPVFDLEQLLKQKTFTRSESDSLMALLRSRTVELPIGVEDRTEKTLSQPSPDLENKMERSQGIVSSPIVNSKGSQDNVASPAELSKANIGSRPPNVSPSVLGLDYQGLREDSTLTHNQSLTLTIKSPTLLSNSSGCFGVRDNGFIGTRYRGRSAIYSMARSPYFGVHPTARKDLKRISAALDDEMGSSGVTRRVRRKPNLSSEGNYGKGVASSQHHASSPQKSLLSNKSKYETLEAVVENGHGVRFPSKSSEMGTKTTQHLEKLSPKQKSSELKLVDSSEKPSPTKLTSTMLSGQALRSLEHVDSSKFMHSFQNNHNLEDMVKDTVVENGPQMLAAPHDTVASPIHADTAADSVKDTLHDVTGSDNNDPIPEAQPTQNGRTFQMSAFEDSVELDDEIASEEPSFSLAVDRREKVEEKQKTEQSMGEIKGVPAKAFEMDKITAESVSKEINNSETGGGSVILEEKSGFTFATPSVTTTPLETFCHTESVSVPEKSLPALAPNDSRPVFGFNPKVNTVPSSTFLLPSLVNESADAKSTTPLAPKSETPNSLENVSSGTTDAQLRITASGEDKNNNDDNNSTQNGGDTKGNLEPVSTSLSTSKVFSFGAPNNNSVLNIPSPSSSAFTSANTHTVTYTAAAAVEVPSVPGPHVSDVRSDKTANSDFKTENKVAFGNQNPLPFSSESFSTVISGSTPTGSSAANPILDNQSPAPLFGTGNGSLIGNTQPSSSSAVTPSTPIKSLLNSSTSAANFFSSSSSFGLTSSTSSEAVSVNTANSFSSTTFGSSLQQDNKPPVHHNPFTSPNLSTGFSFGAPPPSSTTTNTAPLVFGSTPSSGPVFSFGSTPSSSPVFSFGSAALSTSTTTTFSPLSNQPPAFGSTSIFNASPTNNQMSMEDSMAEDPVQTSAPGFGQQPVFSPPSGFMLGSTAPLPGNPFQFGSQPATQNPSPLPGNPFQFGGQPAPQNPSPLPFQASGSLEFNAAGSFSLGSGGGEKSSRRTVKVSKSRNRKKP